MAKSVRYKLNRNICRKNKKRRVKNRGVSKVKKVRNLKPLKIFLSIIAFVILGYWFFVAYTTVREVKIVDVVGENEIVEFADAGQIRRMLLIYEEPNASEANNLFILAVIHNTDISQMLVYHLPGDIYINDYFTKKYISVKDLTYAGKSYMYRDKYAYVIKQIEEQMAINFDSYVLFGSEISKNFISDSSTWGNSEEEVLTIFSKLSLFNLMPRYYKVHLFEEYFHSNMSFLEMYSIFQSLEGVVVSDNYEYFYLGDDEFVREVTLGGSRDVKALNTVAFDQSLRANIDISRTRALRGEHVKVEVYNGSDIPGYARTIARRIYNSGCRVIRFKNASVPYDETKIYVSDMEKFVNGLEVVNDIVKEATVVEGRPSFLTTGDIIVVLGMDQ